MRMNITYGLLKRLQIWYTFTGLKKRNPSLSNCYVLTQVRLWETVLAQPKRVHKFFCYVCIIECRDSWHQWGCSNDPLNQKNEGNKCLAFVSGACSNLRNSSGPQSQSCRLLQREWVSRVRDRISEHLAFFLDTCSARNIYVLGLDPFQNRSWKNRCFSILGHFP